MAYRGVTMIEITEVLRQWVAGGDRKTIARRLGLDPKTVRRYLRAAAQSGRQPGMPAAELTEARLGAIVTALRAPSPRAYGESWQQCLAHRELIATQLRAGV
jgi:predicted transcriptional regulator